MELSLVIATKGRPGQLRRTLASLRACDPLPVELVVVDGDPERSAEPVVAEHVAAGDRPPARYEPSPPGLTRQRNRGIDLVRGEIVVFADDDVDFERDIFAVLAETHAQPGVVGATARIVEEDDRIGGGSSRLRQLLPGGGEQGTMTRFGFPRRLVDLDVPRDVTFMHGCLMSARRDLAAELRFDEALPGYGLLEDEDFGYRMSRRGRVRYEPRASVVHHNLGFSGARKRDFNRMLVVNRTYLLRKNFPGRGRFANLQFGLLFVLVALHRAVNRDWAGIRGLADGIRAVLASPA